MTTLPIVPRPLGRGSVPCMEVAGWKSDEMVAKNQIADVSEDLDWQRKRYTYPTLAITAPKRANSRTDEPGL